MPRNLRRAAFAAVILASLLMPGTLIAAEAPSGGSLLAALAEAETACAQHRNAVYLYLRIAGIVWIVVEWVAAVVLWRTYRLLRAVQRAQS